MEGVFSQRRSIRVVCGSSDTSEKPTEAFAIPSLHYSVELRQTTFDESSWSLVLITEHGKSFDAQSGRVEGQLWRVRVIGLGSPQPPQSPCHPPALVPTTPEENRLITTWSVRRRSD